MKLSFHDYLDKMRGCWNGKNIGGTLGTPFEGMRGLFDIQYYSQPLDKPLPNDDLDLQLVWLNAVEKYGRNINRDLLGEYWLSFIYPDCAEYGAGKNNLRAGLVPPLSGYVGNHYRNSNGSWILTEIWACLCPGHPELAVKYAYEDAIIDHSYEGVYAAVFLAAIESAAFIISDTNALIDIGLSYLPEDSAIHKAVACARACYQSGLTWQQARKKLLQEVPSSFSVLKTDPRDMELDEPVGPIGFDAPGHMGIIVMAWLYGEGDFDKCVSIAASCGEDADCTAGSLAAILGIVSGNGAISEKWLKPLGGMILTSCINRSDVDISIPNTIDELVQRVAIQMQRFMNPQDLAFGDNLGIEAILADESRQCYEPERVGCWYARDYRRTFTNPFMVKHTSHPFDVYVDYHEEPYIAEDVTKKFTLTFENNLLRQQWLHATLHLPEGWEVTPARSLAINLEQAHCNVPLARVAIEITPHNLTQARYDLILQVTSDGHHTQSLIPIVLLTGGDYQIFNE